MKIYKNKSGNALVVVLFLALIAGVGYFIYNSVNSEVILVDQSAAVVGSSSGSSTPPPIVFLSASSQSVTSGQSVIFTWQSSNATSCTGQGFSTGGATNNIKGVSTGTLLANGFTPVIKIFSISCTGPGDTGPDSSQTIKITVYPPLPPIISLSINPYEIESGDSAWITWSSTKTTSCSGSGFFIPGYTTSGKVSTGPLINTNSTPITKTYSVSCKDSIGRKVEKSVSIKINNPASPKVSIYLSPMDIKSGESSWIMWFSKNTTSCNSKDFSTGGVHGSFTSGKVSTGILTATGSSDVKKTYTISCTGPLGTVSGSAPVYIKPLSLVKPTASLSISSQSVVSGQSANITWSSTYATSCTGQGFSTGGKTSGTVSTGVLNTGATATVKWYGVYCSGLGGDSNPNARSVKIMPKGSWNPTKWF